MIRQHQYRLAKRGKWICPKCGHKTFVCYVDENGNVLDEGVGKCDRADNCAYHKPPREYFAERRALGMAVPQVRHTRPMFRPQPRPSYIDPDIFKRSVTATLRSRNNLVDYLKSEFGVELSNQMVGRYYIGTSKHFRGAATVFWQVDQYGNVHGGKVMQYNPTNGKRVKKPFNMVTWAHTVMNIPDFNLRQCLFGEHLLPENPDMAVAVVESEKTAIIGACSFDGFVWLACGGCGNLNTAMCEPLRGRDIVLFPDGGCFDKWRDKAKFLKAIAKSVRISMTMERHGERGDDIADLVIADTWPRGVEFGQFLTGELLEL